MEKLNNILVTGTPGCGKTYFSESLCNSLNDYPIKYQQINVSTFAVENNFVIDNDNARDALNIDEDKLLDELEIIVQSNNESQTITIIDSHYPSLFPERWFRTIVLLTCCNENLWVRLNNRGQSEEKIRENVQAEIMMVVKDETQDSQDKNLIMEIENNDGSQFDIQIKDIINNLSSK